MDIILDYNNDKIEIKSQQIKVVFDHVKNIKLIQQILEEVFNCMDESRLASATPYFDVCIQKMDEDIQTTVGEW